MGGVELALGVWGPKAQIVKMIFLSFKLSFQAAIMDAIHRWTEYQLFIHILDAFLHHLPLLNYKLAEWTKWVWAKLHACTSSCSPQYVMTSSQTSSQTSSSYFPYFHSVTLSMLSSESSLTEFSSHVICAQVHAGPLSSSISSWIVHSQSIFMFIN